ncbi:MAG TPA: hypothetical protein VMF11_15810 [Candidatus Baltobacteraceae bacterium]|nr:hypothetical protein [Candidatus Baltobacteraceae bacterium]
MTYVEWLRVRNALRVVAIILGVFLLVAVVLRISYNRQLATDEIIEHISSHPHTTTHVTLPGGVPRTIITYPDDGTVITIDNVGWGGRHVVVTEPLSHHEDIHQITIGSIHAVQTRSGNKSVTTFDTDAPAPFYFYMAVADVIALIVATVLAAPFAREADGHLEIAATKPVSRAAYAAGAIGVDVAGIVLASLMTVVALLIAQAFFEIPRVDFSGVSIQVVLMGVAFPLAWYAMLAAATSSLRRGYGAVLGFAWPVVLIVVTFAHVPLGDSIFGQVINHFCWAVSRILPLTYANFQFNEDQATGQIIAPGNFGLRVAIEAVLFLVYSALAVAQWRRVEA